MTTLSRRVVLSGLLALGTAPVMAWAHGPGDPMAERLDKAAVAAVAKSYQDVTGDAVDEDAGRDLFPNGVADPVVLRARVGADFEAGRLFVHEGWRLSHTEGRLFTLLTRAE